MSPKIMLLVAIVSSILWAGTCSADAEEMVSSKGMLLCASNKNSLERLACYDDLAKRIGPTVDVSSKTIIPGEWRVRTDTSRFDDTKSVYLTLEAKERISGWPGKSYKPSIIIRCQEKKTEAYIDFGMSTSVEYGLYNKSTLEFRIDKKSPFKIAASKSTDGNALFVPNAVGFSKKLMGAHELLVRVVPFNSPPQETSFNIASLDMAIKPLRAACKW